MLEFLSSFPLLVRDKKARELKNNTEEVGVGRRY
jgi:hypothetical protein